MGIFEWNREEFDRKLESALKEDVPYQREIYRRFFDQAKDRAIPSAVLVLFAHHQDDWGHHRTAHQSLGPSLLFIRRNDDGEIHRGQMAFPGGHCDPEDLNNAITTAVRETEEEVGVNREQVKILGSLPTLVTTTGFAIQPIVGVYKGFMEEISLKLDLSEIAETVWAPLRKLMHPDTYRCEKFSSAGIEYPIDVFQIGPYRIWGATGSITKNLLDRLETLS